MSGSVRCCTVKIRNTDCNWLCATLEVRSYWCNQNTELILICRLYADNSVIAEEGILHLKQCQRSIREAAITVAFFLQSIHHLPENTGVHTVGKRSQKIK